jgi:hypothetical protein
MKTKLLLQSLFAFLPLWAQAQGTFIFDQQSSDESNWATGGNTIQTSQPTGQSFTPSFASVGFVRLQLFDLNRNNGVGATVYVNLRSDSINGPIISSTQPVTMPDSFGLPLNTGFMDFLFATPAALQPGNTYYFQPVVQSGDSWAVAGGSFNYPGGDEYLNGSPFPSDYWFREGIIVPEPSAAALMLFGGAFWLTKRGRFPKSKGSNHNFYTRQG